ncbi:flagellar associated protein, partial [Trypanosoma grayi]|uniref:flagellar associated protein n=1 Tax=Trypanosoma grayi TaxID=71804 RepID=UPI0004F44F01
ASVAQQLGPEMAEQIVVYQGNLTKKAGQMRAMMASLKYFREQTEMYQERYDELHTTLDGLAREYVETRERRDRELTRKGATDAGAGAMHNIDDDAQNDVYLGYIAPPRHDSTEAASDSSTLAAAAGGGLVLGYSDDEQGDQQQQQQQ